MEEKLKMLKIKKLIRSGLYDVMTITVDGKIVEYVFTKKQ